MEELTGKYLSMVCRWGVFCWGLDMVVRDSQYDPVLARSLFRNCLPNGIGMTTFFGMAAFFIPNFAKAC